MNFYVHIHPCNHHSDQNAEHSQNPLHYSHSVKYPNPKDNLPFNLDCNRFFFLFYTLYKWIHTVFNFAHLASFPMRFIHVIANGSSFLLRCVITLYECTTVCVHTYCWRTLSCFQVGDVMNKSARSTLVVSQKSW